MNCTNDADIEAAHQGRHDDEDDDCQEQKSETTDTSANSCHHDDEHDGEDDLLQLAKQRAMELSSILPADDNDDEHVNDGNDCDNEEAARQDFASRELSNNRASYPQEERILHLPADSMPATKPSTKRLTSTRDCASRDSNTIGENGRYPSSSSSSYFKSTSIKSTT